MSAHTKIKWKYMLILLLLFILMVAGRLYYDFNHYEGMLKDKITLLKKDIKYNFKSSKKELSLKYTTIAHQFMLDENLGNMHENRHRKKMYNYLKDNYEELLKDDPNLYVMHFFDTKNTTVLRMHKPNSFDDDLTKERPLVKYVNETKKETNVFEVGKNGIVYRVTVPFIHKGKHIGVLEFGIKLRHFIESINSKFHVKSKAMVKSKYLKHLTTARTFKKDKDYAIIFQNRFFENTSSKIDISRPTQIIKENDESYIILTDLNFKNHLGEEIAKIIIAKNITDFIKENNLTRLSANSITVVALILALILLYIVFTKYENDIIESYKKVSILEKKSNYLKNKSNKDNLTDIYNKTYFNNYLQRYIEEKNKGVILFFDIDHFKKCNDTYGHLVGDVILIQLSKTIQKNLRDSDLFARWGGEEFVILLENVSINKAPKIAEKIRTLIEDSKLADGIKTTISIGVTAIKKDDTLESLMLRADELLYDAKKEGRNKVVSDIS